MVEELKVFAQANTAELLLLGGLGVGVLFGAVANRTGFCTLGAVSDWVAFGDTRRLRSWALAAAIAIFGAWLLEALGVTDLSLSMYQSRRLDWAGAVAGGVIFGVGMALAGGCTSRNLVRAGSGDLRSIISLVVIALFAEMTLGGALAPLRNWLTSMTAITIAAPAQGLGDVAAATLGSDRGLSRTVAALAFGGVLLLWALGSHAFRASPRHVGAGVGIGLAIVAGWAVTGLTYDELSLTLARPQSLTFVRPTSETLTWLERMTARGWPGFGVATVTGVLIGSFALAIATRSFRLATFADAADTLRQLSGAALMGFGGIMGLGCSIGQGLTGVSTLAVGSLLATVSIIFGVRLGLKVLERSAA